MEVMLKKDKNVKREDYEKFREAIARTQMISVFDLPIDIYDYNVYLLYMANNGSKDDIEAQFAGYDFISFDNQTNIKYIPQKFKIEKSIVM